MCSLFSAVVVEVLGMKFPRILRGRFVNLKRSAAIFLLLAIYVLLYLVFDDKGIYVSKTQVQRYKSGMKETRVILSNDKSLANQMLPPANFTLVSMRDPFVENSNRKQRDDDNDALYVARLVTQYALSERTTSESLTKKLAYFRPVMTFDEKRILMDIARRLDFIASQWNITYFLYGGALLGSFRHHDIIPWDDDLDFFVDLTQRYTLFRAISASADCEVFVAGPRMKVWSKQSRKMSKYPWGWPYVDISFYDENDTHIWDSAEEYKDTCVYPKSIAFPLHKRPLAGHFFNAPRDSYANLKLTYKSADCSTHYYSHKYEKKVKKSRRYTIPCDILSGSVPFVHRSRHEEGITEVLKLGESVLNTLVLDEPSYVITNPFRLEIE